MAAWLQERGFVARPIVYPTVPMGRERVRVCVHSGNSREEIGGLVEGIRTWLEVQPEGFTKGGESKL